MGISIDSDNNFQTKGKILSLIRGKPEGSNYDKKNLVTLIIESDKNKHIVDLPIKTNSDFEIMPYQSALLEADVSYSKEGKSWEEGFTTYWKLEVLSGKLKGNTYKFSRG
jgi:hypothetical protein